MKETLLAIVVFLSSFVLTSLTKAFVDSENYISFDIMFMVYAIGLMLVLAISLNLAFYSKIKWYQYLVLPTATLAGFGFYLSPYNINYVAIFLILAFLILNYEILKASKLKTNLIKLDNRFVFKDTIKTTLLLFGFFAMMLVLFNPNLFANFDIGKTISKSITSQVEKVVGDQLEQTLAPYKDSGIDPQLISPGIDLNTLVEDQVNTAITPYKKFVNPVMALIAFSVLQLFGFLTSILYGFVIDLVVWLAIKINFVKIETIQVEKQEPVL